VVILGTFRLKDNRRVGISKLDQRAFTREFGLGGSKIRDGSDARMMETESCGSVCGLGKGGLPPKVRKDLKEGRKLLESARKADEPKKD
jgi:hypothetical protein